jgi:hypothetical protein
MGRTLTKEFRIFPALREDTDKGWVWLYDNSLSTSRQTIRIKKGRYSVYCEHRVFDENVARHYNENEDTKHRQRNDETLVLKREADVIVISGWYRGALGGLKLQDEGGPKETLTICKPRIAVWADLRAGCHHPEPSVRVGTRIAILSTWLGVAALLPSLTEIHWVKRLFGQGAEVGSSVQGANPLNALAWLVVLVFGVVCLWGARGVRRER